MLGIEKIDSLSSLLEKIWKYKVHLGIGISFISSLFAPIVSVLGWPATIIFITCLGSCSFLLLLFVIRRITEYKDFKQCEDKIKNEIIDIADKYDLEEISQEQSRNMIDTRMIFANQELKRKLEPLMKRFCGEDQYSDDDYDKFYCLWKDFQPFQREVNNLLLYKVAPKIKTGEVSKQTIKFLSSITDIDLEILKKQFKYVLKIPHKDDKSDTSSQDLAIFSFENADIRVQNLLMKEEGLFLLAPYHVKFYGDVWLGENNRESNYILKNNLEVIDNIDSNGLFKIQIAVREKEQPKKGQLATLHSPLIGLQDETHKSKVTFPVYTCLGGVGMEIFNLLKNELEPAPEKYMNNLVEYWNKNNPQFDFKLISEQKFIINNNS